MAKKNDPAPSKEEILAQASEEEQPFALTEDMKQFIEYRKATGIPSPLDTLLERKEFLGFYNQWVKQGRPRPSLPDLAPPQDPIPLKLCRIKHHGVQYIYWFGSDHQYHGKTVKRTPKMVDEVITSESIKDGSIVKHRQVIQAQQGTKEIVTYSIPFKKEVAEALVQDSRDRGTAPAWPMCSLVSPDGRVWSVDPYDFVHGNYDDLLRSIGAIRAPLTKQLEDLRTDLKEVKSNQ